MISNHQFVLGFIYADYASVGNAPFRKSRKFRGVEISVLLYHVLLL